MGKKGRESVMEREEKEVGVKVMTGGEERKTGEIEVIQGRTEKLKEIRQENQRKERDLGLIHRYIKEGREDEAGPGKGSAVTTCLTIDSIKTT